jgi:hypothetical protein
MQANRIIPTPSLSALDLSHLCAQYLQVRFRSELGQRSSQPTSVTMAPLPTPPIMLPVSLTVELDCISKTLADAFLNRGQWYGQMIYASDADMVAAEKIHWDATRYSEKLQKKPGRPGTVRATTAESAMRRRYPPRSGPAAAGVISCPCIVVDMDNVILAWYLPGILNDSRQVSPLICLISAANIMCFRVQ